MLRFLGKCKSLTQIQISENSRTRFCLDLWKSQSFYSVSVSSCNNGSSSSSSTSTTGHQSSFTVGGLINSQGLSTQIPHGYYDESLSVIKLLENCGFSQTQIETVVSKRPGILNCGDPEKVIKPKIDFFRSVGISEEDVVKMITRDPLLLGRSLKDHLIPSFDLLTNILGGEQNAVCAIKSWPFIFHDKVSRNLEPNLLTLKNLGVPEALILKVMLKWRLIKIIVRTPNDWFSEAVGAVMKMGFDPCSSSFAHAVTAMALHNKESNWGRKLGFYRSLGFSDKEIISMFRKLPQSMSMSEEKIMGAVELYINKFRWSPSQLSARPNVLMYSLEKRIIPRCSVLQLLVSRGKIHKNVRLLTILCPTEKDFVGRYVTKYKDEFPEVLDAYRGKLKFDEYNFDSGELRG